MTSARLWIRLGMALLALGLLGCGSAPRLYVNPDADMTFYGKVAVVPFDNLSGERFASDRVMRAFVTELVLTRRFTVVEAGEFSTALDKIGGAPGVDGKYDPEKLKTAATNVQSTGLIQGSVSEYRMQRVGLSDAPVVTFDVEMRDVATGTLVWRASITKRGKARFPLFGGTGTRTFGQLVQSVCQELVHDLEQKAF